ncbi:class I SAM-dependent rRNA methyltransferase [Isobaculum melis]|nr:class I SAM-dependent rRNA methyltransferase [Isobaculum melis]
MNIQLRRKAISHVKRKYPLLVKDDFVKVPNYQEGDVVTLVDQEHHFLATAYLATQNKGDGWVLSFQPNEKIDVAFFTKKFQLAYQERAHLYQDEATTAFRFFNGEGDGLGGLTIDYYAGYYLFSWYSEGIYRHHEMILQGFKEALSDIIGIYQKFRYELPKGQTRASFLWGNRAPEPLIIKENGIQYATYLDEGMMTGIFLDQREVRRTIQEQYAAGKNVLNTFSYTGAFSVAAAMGGATTTTSVDLANRSLEKTKEQFLVNQLPLESQKIYVMDVFDYFKYAVKKELTFDTVILDPPSFARSKKRTFSAAKDYTSLLEDAIALTERNGIIVASTNAAQFNMDKFKEMIHQAFQRTGKAYQIEAEYQLPVDFKVATSFPEGNYLKVCIIRNK